MLTPRRARTLLRCLLIFNGLLTIGALPAVFLSTAWMDVFHRQLGLGPLPPGTIVQYLARSLSAFYVAYGTLTLVLAWDVVRHAPLVTWWGLASITLGLLLFGIDRTVGMRAFWTWGEGVYLVSTGSAVLLLQHAGRQAGAPRV
jgi:hypothetical protein